MLILWLKIVLGNTNDLLFYIQKEYKQLVCTLFYVKSIFIPEGYFLFSKYSAIAATSLSPRPDTLTIITLSLSIFGARLITSASA